MHRSKDWDRDTRFLARPAALQAGPRPLLLMEILLVVLAATFGPAAEESHTWSLQSSGRGISHPASSSCGDVSDRDPVAANSLRKPVSENRFQPEIRTTNPTPWNPARASIARRARR